MAINCKHVENCILIPHLGQFGCQALPPLIEKKSMGGEMGFRLLVRPHHLH